MNPSFQPKVTGHCRRGIKIREEQSHILSSARRLFSNRVTPDTPRCCCELSHSRWCKVKASFSNVESLRCPFLFCFQCSRCCSSNIALVSLLLFSSVAFKCSLQQPSPAFVPVKRLLIDYSVHLPRLKKKRRKRELFKMDEQDFR